MTFVYLLLLASVAISGFAQLLIKARYDKYSKIENKKKLSGFDVAQQILKKNGLENIYIVETQGYLSDHFDPTANVVRLSSSVFHGTTIASVAIAAHECGHAVQHKEGMSLIKIRSKLVPVVNFCSKAGYIAIAIGLFGQLTELFYIGIGLLSTILLFQLVTLPVEFDASTRGMINIEKMGLLTASEKSGASKVLVAAALTYVASLITTILEIARLVLSASRDR